MSKLGGSSRVSRYLARHLRAAGPGEALPSFRTLIRDCQVSPAIVSGVVKRLEEDNLVAIRAKSGLYASERAAGQRTEWGKLKRVDILDLEPAGQEVNPSDPVGGYFRSELIWYLGQVPTTLEMGIRFHGIQPDSGGREELRSLLASDEIEAAIVMRLLDPSFLNVLREAHVPFVCLYPESPTPPSANSVLVDSEAIIAAQIEHLCRLGHRRIGFMHLVDPRQFHHNHLIRREAFIRIAQERRLPIDFSLLRYAGHSDQSRSMAAEELLSLSQRPTAIICHDEDLAALYRVAGQHGLTIGRELSVMSTNDGPPAQQVNPSATTVNIPRREAVVAAYEMLDQVIRMPDPVVPNRLLETPLIVRGSTGPVPGNV